MRTSVLSIRSGLSRVFRGKNAYSAGSMKQSSSTRQMSTSVEYPAFIRESIKDMDQSVLDRMNSTLYDLHASAGSGHINHEVIATQMNQYYLPMFVYINSMYKSHLSNNKSATGKPAPLFIGISAPQGCGKTTLTDMMSTLFALNDVNCIAMSLDDFYLKHEDQLALKDDSNGNKLLELRGNAGSHDMSFMYDTLAQMKDVNNDDSSPTAMIPRYDKSAYGGKGDRAVKEQWLTVDTPIDIILFEGWMLGFEAKESITGNKEIETVNEYLRSYKALHEWFDAWIVIALSDMQLVYKWRSLAEEKMRAAGLGGMSQAEVTDFVNRYMPAYETYLPQLYKEGPERRDSKESESGKVSSLQISINEYRSPVDVQYMK